MSDSSYKDADVGSNAHTPDMSEREQEIRKRLEREYALISKEDAEQAHRDIAYLLARLDECREALEGVVNDADPGLDADDHRDGGHHYLPAETFDRAVRALEDGEGDGDE